VLLAAPEVRRAVLGGVLDADVEADHAEVAERVRKLRGDRLGAALPDDADLTDAEVVEVRADGADARERRLWFREEEVVVVEAEDAGLAGASPEQRHLLGDGLWASKPDGLAATVSAPIGVEAGDRAVGAATPAAAAAHDGNEGHAEVTLVLAVAPREGERVEVVPQAAGCGALRTVGAPQRQPRDALDRCALPERVEELDERVLAVVEDDGVDAPARFEHLLPGERRELSAGRDVPLEPRSSEARREAEELVGAMLKLQRETDDVGASSRVRRTTSAASSGRLKGAILTSWPASSAAAAIMPIARFSSKSAPIRTMRIVAPSLRAAKRSGHGHAARREIRHATTRANAVHIRSMTSMPRRPSPVSS